MPETQYTRRERRGAYHISPHSSVNCDHSQLSRNPCLSKTVGLLIRSATRSASIDRKEVRHARTNGDEHFSGRLFLLKNLNNNNNNN